MFSRVSASKIAMSFVLIVVLLSMLSVVAVMAQDQQEQPVVKMFLFFSGDCPDCQRIINEYLPVLDKKYGSQIQVQLMGIEDSSAYSLLLNFEKSYGVSPDRATVPEIFVGDYALIGTEEIETKLEPIIDELLAAGGADFPMPRQLQPPTLEPIPTVTPNPAGSVEGAVHAMLFFSPTCPHCEHIRKEVMPGLYEKYGEQLVVREFDVTEPYYFELEMAIEEAAGLPEDQRGFVPLVVVGRYLLTNANTIQLGLDEIIKEGLAEGGIGWPVDESLFEVPEDGKNLGKVELTGEAEGTTLTKPLEINMAYFFKTGCQECDRVQYEVNYLENKYEHLNVLTFDISGYAELNEWLCAKYNVPDKYRLTAPAIFIGDDYLVGKDVTTQNIEALVEKYSETGADVTWENWEEEAPQAASRIIERFKSFGGLTVILAGLIDGLNPCAFATIVFFISYLAFAGRKGKEILLVGAAFALGVFLTYLLVGFGLYQILQRLPFLTTLGRWVYGITAALCLILAVISFIDYLSARRGTPEEMRLRLPLRLRRKINQVIRESATAPTLAGVAFISGFVISLIELACTGQVYLPTILFVLGIEELRVNAIFYLLLYNLMFVLPLIIVFILAYLGTTSEQLSQFVNKHTSTIKLATAALFLLLGIWMLTLIF